MGSCKSALTQWRMQSEEDQHALVVVLFRQPYPTYFSSAAKRQSINPVKPPIPLPYPKSVMEPDYPANALGQGSVILRLDITSEGRIESVQVIKSLGILTDTSIEAVRKWEFVPLKDKKGKKVPSHAYAILVFRFPVLAS